MNRKIWFYLSIFLMLLATIQSMMLFPLLYTASVPEKLVSMKEESKHFQTGGIRPVCGYIPDAETAANVGGAIIDQIFEDEGITVLPWEKGKAGVNVEYDPELRLWEVGKGLFARKGALIIIEQDTATVINVWFTK